MMSLVEFGELNAPVLLSVHAEEAVGVNAIPEVMADLLAKFLGWELERLVVQANVVNHTGPTGLLDWPGKRFLKEKSFQCAII